MLLRCLHSIFLGFFAGPTVEQQAEMARAGGRTLAALQPEQVTINMAKLLILCMCGKFYSTDLEHKWAPWDKNVLFLCQIHCLYCSLLKDEKIKKIVFLGAFMWGL